MLSALEFNFEQRKLKKTVEANFKTNKKGCLKVLDSLFYSKIIGDLLEKQFIQLILIQ
jgi:hypothetical protein